MTEWKQFLEEHLKKNPEFKKRWDAGAPLRAVTQQLLAMRILRGLSQNDIARRAKITQAHISRIESGLSDPRLSTLIKMAQAMEFSIIFKPKEG